MATQAEKAAAKAALIANAPKVDAANAEQTGNQGSADFVLKAPAAEAGAAPAAAGRKGRPPGAKKATPEPAAGPTPEQEAFLTNTVKSGISAIVGIGGKLGMPGPEMRTEDSVILTETEWISGTSEALTETIKKRAPAAAANAPEIMLAALAIPYAVTIALHLFSRWRQARAPREEPRNITPRPQAVAPADPPVKSEAERKAEEQTAKADEIMKGFEQHG